MSLPITAIVAKPSWKQILVELVISEKLDPWNIDLVVAADSFYNYVKKMEKFDFHIPANIILACAILLKYKSNAIRFYEEPQAEELPPAEAEEPIQPLALSWRIPPKRQITLNELMGEMERVIRYDTVERPQKVAAQLPTLELDLDNYDIETEIDQLYSRLKGVADSEGIVLFSALMNGGGAEGVVSTITPLLHLAQRKSVYLRQDRFFGEIFINVNGMAETAVSASHRGAMLNESRKEGNGNGNGNGKEGNGKEAHGEAPAPPAN